MATTIALEQATRERLRTFGHAGQTYDDILLALMDEVDRERFVEEAHRRIDDPGVAWVDLEDVA